MVFGENGAMESRLDRQGRACLATGGARGIGRADLERFIEAGAKVAIADIQPEDARNETSFLEQGSGHPSGRLSIFKLQGNNRICPRGCTR